ncbi:putative neuroplastin [Trichinella spiralis]|uniref:putative neuroplastin n=1 Tax=Trichinella spiralis TaxID=6334 RepID=UPI0001EFEE9D|nr:putative neuroplastin [Trichinella spiralis]
MKSLFRANNVVVVAQVIAIVRSAASTFMSIYKLLIISFAVFEISGTIDVFKNNAVYAHYGQEVSLFCTPKISLSSNEKRFVQWTMNSVNICESSQGVVGVCYWRKHDGVESFAVKLKAEKPMKLSCIYNRMGHDDWDNATVQIFTGGDGNPVRVSPSYVDFNESDTTIELACSTNISAGGFLWYHNNELLRPSDKVLIFTNGSLILSKPTSKETGIYACIAKNWSVGGFVEVRGKATISDKHQVSKNMLYGETAELSCPVYGYPMPNIVWKRENEDLIVDYKFNIRMLVANDSGRIHFESCNGIANGTLIIRDATYDDRASYTCVATNEFGSDNFTVLIRVKDKLAALWPFLGIVTEVVILMIAIFIFEKRRTKHEELELKETREHSW